VGVVAQGAAQALSPELLKGILEEVRKANSEDRIHQLNPNLIVGGLIVLIIGVTIVIVLQLIRHWKDNHTGL